jgi:hypothetical protein
MKKIIYISSIRHIKVCILDSELKTVQNNLEIILSVFETTSILFLDLSVLSDD